MLPWKYTVWMADRLQTETRSKLIAFPRELIYKVPLVLGTK